MGRRLDSIADPTDRKHAYTPSLFDNDTNIKLGFMYGNPYDAVLSVFRRGYQNLHSQAMNADSSTPAAMLTGVSLEEYLEKGVDEFRIEPQLDFWLDPTIVKHPTILIRYETMTEHLDEIFDFFEYNKLFEFLTLLERKKPFKVRKRTSSWEQQPKVIRQQLETIYGRVNEIISAAPDLKIMMPDENQHITLQTFDPQRPSSAQGSNQ